MVRLERRRRRAEAVTAEVERRVQEGLADVKQLRGLLPICSYCKKIRDDQQYWHGVESYVSPAHGRAVQPRDLPRLLRETRPARVGSAGTDVRDQRATRALVGMICD
jgi:hypothetical protein